MLHRLMLAVIVAGSVLAGSGGPALALNSCPQAFTAVTADTAYHAWAVARWDSNLDGTVCMQTSRGFESTIGIDNKIPH